jgi:hypothetical protein
MVYTNCKSKKIPVSREKSGKQKQNFMSKNSFYKIIASPRHQRNIFTKILHNPKKRQVIVSILSIYTLVGGMVAFSMFGRTNEPAKAYEPALISSSITLKEDKEFIIGDIITVNLTVQNTSSDQAINDMDVELLSTKDAIKWSKIENSNPTTSSKKISIENNHAKIGLLSNGERIEYTISGELKDNQTPLSTVIGKIKFTNLEGNQDFTSNKILVSAKESKPLVANVLEVKSDKSVYKTNEAINLTLAPQGEFDIKNVENTTGKIYITNKVTKEVVRDASCTFDESYSCTDTVETLPVGKYSTLFIGKNGDRMSLIGQFEIVGKSGEFQPDVGANLEFPFGEKSINGIVAIYARKVVNLNNAVKPSDSCNFSILKDGQSVATARAQVDSDGSCHTLISGAQVPADGIYTIKLNGTNLQKDISIIKKGEKFINFANKNLVLTKNKPLNFEAKDILDLTATTPTPLNNSRVSIGILHQPTGDYEETTNSNGELFKVLDGKFNLTLPGQSFQKGGLYSIFMKTEDGQVSDFVTVSLDDREIGFSTTNVQVDNVDNLKVGKTMIFSIQGLTDRNSNTIPVGECAADIFTTVNAVLPILVKGEIKDGNCSVKVDPDKITQAGPILVSFTGDDISNKVNQSRQFNIKPGSLYSYGYMNLEYEPAREGYANNVIIGPVTDIKGNLTNALNKKLVIKTNDQILKQYDSIDIQNGFAKVSVPGSTLIEGEVTIGLYDNDEANTLLTSKIIKAIKSEDKLFLPAFPSVINSGEKIKVSMDNIPNANVDTECKLTFIKSNTDYFDGVGKYNTEKSQCVVEFELDTFRTNTDALLRFQAGDYVYANTVKLESAEAANLFTITPQIEKTIKNEVNVRLLSSPIVDKQGKAITNGKVKVQYNGKIEEAQIKNGLIKLDIDAKKLDNKDITSKFDQKFLDLNINAKAGITSISKTNNLSIFLGNKDVAAYKTVTTARSAQTQVEAKAAYNFVFESEFCNVNTVNGENKITPALSHQQGELCYVQVLEEETGDYSLSFEENSFVKYTFDFKVVTKTPKVKWSTNNPLNVEVIGETKSDEKVILFDGENQYKFENRENNSGIKVNQNGLNPIKDYRLEAKFSDKDGNEVTHFKSIVGEKISK